MLFALSRLFAKSCVAARLVIGQLLTAVCSNFEHCSIAGRSGAEVQGFDCPLGFDIVGGCLDSINAGIYTAKSDTKE
jgi:hypothetical protein